MHTEQPTPMTARPHQGALRRLALAFVGSVVAADVSEPVVALTFDDGPDPATTPSILGALADHRSTATFFVIAEQAEAHPDLLRAVRDAGHDVGVHGGPHRPLAESPWRDTVAAIRHSRRRIEHALGGPVRYFRPPFGSQSRRSYALARLTGLEVVLWNRVAYDYRELPVERMVAAAVQGIRPGDVVLLHDRFEDHFDRDLPAPDLDRGALTGAILDGLGDLGLRSVGLSTLLGGAGRARRTARFGTPKAYDA